MTDRPDRSFVASVLSGAPPFAVFRAQICADGLGRRRPRRRRLRLRPVARSGQYLQQPRACAGQQRSPQGRAAGRLCRHRRAREAVGDFGEGQHQREGRQGRQRQQRRLAVPAGLADGALLPPLRRTRWPAAGHARRTARRTRRGDRPGFRLLHFRRRLCRHQQSRGRRRRQGRSDDRRRQDLQGQGDRHRRAHRPRADQGRGRLEFPVRQAVRRQAADRRLGARGRQSVRPRRHRDGRHRLGQRPRHRQRSV